MLKNPLNISFLVSVISFIFFPFVSIHASAAVVYSNGFDSMPIGTASKDDVKAAWSTRYSVGPSLGRLRIVEGGTFAKSGKAAEVKYPANSHSTSDSGDTWETPIGDAEELYLSYWVKFDINFDFVKGGKMPGLAGGTGFPGDDAFTTRLMWREDGKLEFYLHGFDVNNSAGEEPYRVLWDDFGSHAQLIPGKWHHIETHVKLNTPGLRDGLLEGWLDGKLVCQERDSANVRATGQGGRKINFLFFSTFFGGSSAPVSQWQPKSDVFAYYDDFVVSTTRAGGSGGSSSIAASSASSSSTSSASSSSPSTSDCFKYTGNSPLEVSLPASKCIQFEGGLTGKTLQVWDSDTNPSCDFRGAITSLDGAGSLDVSSNFVSTGNFTGTKLKFTPSNGCDFVKIRLF